MYVLDASKRGFAPIVHRDALGLAAFAFTDAESAESARAQLAAATKRGATPRVVTLAANDARAREEWLRAVDAAGAARGLIDPPLPLPTAPLRGELTRALLADVLSGKRFVACL